jgi:glycosyltransferase involved in cell wall biosynthesis
LLFPPGDAAVLADRIGHIFKNDELAIKLGINAKAVAMERHNPDRVVNQLLMAYNQAIMNSL